MKNLVLTLMVLLIAIGLAVPMVGGTFASFSDIEISEGNYIETADLDLKVNGKDDLEVETFFEIAHGEICTIYPSSPSPIPLSNEGSVDGPLYLHIKNLIGPDSLSQDVDMEIWYDGKWVTKGSLYDLACQQIELGHMPADGIITEVTMELHASGGTSGQGLTFDIAFELFGACGYSDIETSRGNYLAMGCEWEGCSHGFWKNWKRHEEAWAPTGYDPSDDFDATFSDCTFVCNAFDPNITLMKALELKGGGLNALARDAVGALLNAAHPGVNYPLTTVAEVMGKVQEAIESGEYDATQKELNAYNSLEGPLCED